MRDLFRFLYRIRSTLVFLGLMTLSLLMLYNGSFHHRAKAISSSNAVVGTLFQWRSEVTAYTGLRDVNRALAEENARLHALLASTPPADSAAPPPMMDSAALRDFRFVSARVIASTWQKRKNFITLDKGSEQGMEPDMGVIGPNGIVGVVRSVSPRFSSVISVLSPDVKHSVLLQRTGHFGLLFWDTGDPLTASLTDVAKHVRVNVGDTVVTMGADGIFPRGVPVGVVDRVDRDKPGIYLSITLRLAEDLTRIGYVHGVKDLRKAERDSLQLENGQP
jgi:rod shape-determining protein MreC